MAGRAVISPLRNAPHGDERGACDRGQMNYNYAMMENSGAACLLAPLSLAALSRITGI
jgi:hypothetical protein